MKSLIMSTLVLLMFACTSSPKKSDTIGDEKTISQDQKIIFAGTYSYGRGADKGPSGDILIFPKDDSTLLFNINLSVGPPSYNMGALYDTIQVKDNQAIYYKRAEDEGKGCKWKIDFYGDSLTIKTLDEAYECGFGGNVFADGTYKVVDHEVPAFYVTMEGDTISFGK